MLGINHTASCGNLLLDLSLGCHVSYAIHVPMWIFLFEGRLMYADGPGFIGEQIALYFVFILQSLDPVVNTTPVPPIPISRGAPRGSGETQCSLPTRTGAVLLGEPPKQGPVKEHASALDWRPRRCCLRWWVLSPSCVDFAFSFIHYFPCLFHW